MDAFNAVLKAVGALVLAGGGLSLIVYQMFKYLASRWLDSKFDERLQNLKHQQQKELEGLRLKMSALLDRAVKLHQREFDVLPEAWAKLNDAYWYARSFLSRLQSYPDLDRMGLTQVQEFIATCSLQQWQKAELTSEQNKTEYYRKAIFWHKLNEALNRAREAHRYSVKNGIFISTDLRTDFAAIHDLVWNALAEQQANEEYDVKPRNRQEIEKLNSGGDQCMEALERKIHGRLWPSTNESLKDLGS